jgi:hypothetical protein
MIVRKVWFWTRSTIQDAVETFAGAGGGIRYAYFYADRVVMAARPLKDTRGVQAVVTKDEVIDGDVADVVGLIWAKMHGNLLFRLRALEAESA